jgi:predicted amidophosphoribosyltransferase
MASTYSEEELDTAILAVREGADYCLLTYPPKRRMNDVSKLIWDLKENQPQAIRKVVEILVPHFRSWEKQIGDIDKCRYVLTIPGHEKGKQNLGCDAVANSLCDVFKWLKHIPNGLRRVKTVAKAAHAGSLADRPTYEDHRDSIEYDGPSVERGVGILMLDDVLTTSETSTACRDILLEESGCKRVTGLFIGKTQ